jgi:DNA-binding transcriptional regulator YhcF (GntR family)
MPAKASRTMRIELDPRLRLPVYLQIVRQLQDHAGAGRLPVGAQLPTVRGLARRLGVNFNTVARAYRVLARDGTLSTQPGRGTFVLTMAPRRRRGRGALHELARDFVVRARRLNFSDAQITTALERGLLRARAARPAGDNHE